jgi:cysteine-rich repeat protein
VLEVAVLVTVFGLMPLRSAVADTGAVTFAFTATAQTFLVPAGVTSLDFEVMGAQGGGEYGGLGARVRGTLAVTPGETLDLFVGGKGTMGGAALNGSFNGGGGGFWGGAGGGASDIRREPYALPDRVVVAGGGGGAMRGPIFGMGGSGGADGEDGAPSTCVSGGGGGTQSSGGAGGGNGGAGVFGLGGSSEGSGGGGGWWGGGSSNGGVASDCSGGGGAGSSHIADTVTNGAISKGWQFGDGLIRLGWPTLPHVTYPKPASAFVASGSASGVRVPSGTASISVGVYGAQGGGSAGGPGGETAGTLPITPGTPVEPGTPLLVVAGLRGTSGASGLGGAFNGGGSGFWEAAGGGASDVRIGGWLPEDRVIVGGGGGGGKTLDDGGVPGGAGGMVGGDGYQSSCVAGGGGGTQSNGGAGGGTGSAGQFGQGGAGGPGFQGGGGGGGGGWYGGGGSEGGGGSTCSGGGGGGSSYASPLYVQNAEFTDASVYGNGMICFGFDSTPDCTGLTCGDGHVDIDLGEGCDDGNRTPEDGCSDTCQEETGWTCTGTPSVCQTTCGDGVKAGHEECDDHNSTDDDGCEHDCTLTPEVIPALPCDLVKTKSGIVSNTFRLSTGEAGEGNGPSGFAKVSGDGRYVAFLSQATNLEPATCSQFTHPCCSAANPCGGLVHLKDRKTGFLLASYQMGFGDGLVPDTALIRWEGDPTISADGKCLAATVLLGASDPEPIIWIAHNGEHNRYPLRSIYGRHPVLSDNCRYLAYESTHQYDGRDTDTISDVYITDLGPEFADSRLSPPFIRGTTLVSITSSGGKSTGGGFGPAISRDGRYVAFVSKGTDIVPGITGAAGANGYVFVMDTSTNTVTLVSKARDGSEPNFPLVYNPTIGFGGNRYIAYASSATNLTPEAVHNPSNVFLYDMEIRRSVLVSAASSGHLSSGSNWGPSVSDDGDTVAFLSDDPNLDDPAHPGDLATEQGSDGTVADNVYVRHRHDRRTTLVTPGASANPFTTNDVPAVSADGSYVAFASDAPLSSKDENNVNDIYGRGTDHGNCYKWVALGDSYSSGEGTKDYDLGTDNYKGNIVTSHLDKWFDTDSCHRSAHAYSRLGIDNWHGIGPNDLLHVACSGAVMENILGVLQYDEVPQIEWVRRNAESLQLITMSIGGNNAGFGDVGMACGTGSCPSWPESKLKVTALMPQWLDTYAEIHNAAPNARIVILNYPRAVDWNSNATGCAFGVCQVTAGSPPYIPPSGFESFIGCSGDWTCAFAQAACELVPNLPPLSSGTYRDLGIGPTTVAFALKFEDYLNARIRKAVHTSLRNFRKADRQTPKDAITMVDLSNAVRGHEVCSQDEYINYLTADGHDLFHPNVKGNEAMNRFLKGALFGCKVGKTCPF